MSGKSFLGRPLCKAQEADKQTPLLFCSKEQQNNVKLTVYC